jgi:hypothetical protein
MPEVQNNTISAEVVRIIYTSLTQDGEKARTFVGAELLTATSIFSKLGDCFEQKLVEDMPGRVLMRFNDVEAELNTNEKALLLRLIDAIAWTVQDGKSVASAKEALA